MGSSSPTNPTQPISSALTFLSKQAKVLPHAARRSYSKLHKDFLGQLAIICLVLVATSFAYLSATRHGDSGAAGSDPEAADTRIADTQVKDLFEINAAVLTFCGLVLTAANLHAQYHHEKMLKSSYYVEAWYNSGMGQSLKVLRDIKEEEFDNKVKGEFCPNPQQECIILALEVKAKRPETLETIQARVATRLDDNRDERKHVNEVLSFFEHMGQDVKFGVVDEDYLKEFFFQAVTNYYEILEQHVKGLQQKYGSPITFCNFVFLADRWEKTPYRPHLSNPDGCG